jgi:hypothetical protein
MRATRSANLIAQLLPLLAFPIRAMAQTTGGTGAAAPPTSSAPGGTIAGMVMEVALLLAMLLAIVVGIKLYDLKRQREAEVLSRRSCPTRCFSSPRSPACRSRPSRAAPFGDAQQ